MNKKIKILAIESSCDETAAAVIQEQGTPLRSSDYEGRANDKEQIPVILSNVISSQIDLHAKTGGVVPEVASRAHMEAIIPVVTEALLEAPRKLSITNYQLSIKSQSSNTNKSIENLEIDKLNGNWKLEVGNYQEASGLLDDITHIAYTAGPGLIGSLLVGYNAAKTLAYSLNLPIIPVNHIEGHLYSAFISRGISNSQFLISNQIPNTDATTEQYCNETIFPLLSLTVSGGHTSLILMKDHGQYELLGQTLDDAVGEAYDKVAQLLDLGYPGGPAVSKLAAQYRASGAGSREPGAKTPNTKLPNPNQLVFPRPILHDGTFNFSLSGLKTAVLREVIERKKSEKINESDKMEIAFAFEEAVADILAAKTAGAIKKYNPKTVEFVGGVSANGYLRERLQEMINGINPSIEFLTPLKGFSGDNAAMIGLAAYFHIQRGDLSNWREIRVDSNLKLA